MKKLFKDLFVTKTAQTRRTSQQRRRNSFTPQLETLEDRVVLSSSPIVEAIPMEEIQGQTVNARFTMPGITDTNVAGQVGETIMAVEAHTTDPTKVSEKTCNTLAEVANGLWAIATDAAIKDDWSEAARLNDKSEKVLEEAEDAGCLVIYSAKPVMPALEAQFGHILDLTEDLLLERFPSISDAKSDSEVAERIMDRETETTTRTTDSGYDKMADALWEAGETSYKSTRSIETRDEMFAQGMESDWSGDF